MPEDQNVPKENKGEKEFSPELEASFREILLNEIRKRVKPQQFDTWFRKLPLVEFVDTDNSVHFKVPNLFYLEWLKTRYLPTIKEAAGAITGSDPSIEFSLAISTSFDEKEVVKFPENEPLPEEDDPFKDQIELNRNYTFENYVVGPCNRMSHAAMLSVVESPAMAYNPLFVYGSVGLGKTHLLQATCAALEKKKRKLRPLYLTCETFLNHFIESIEKGDLENFRSKYRKVDVLFVDDIQLLANKERTQEEFFHTFNALYNSNKQIILSSDRPPKEIPTLEERLVSRFKWGLVTQLEPPSFEIRVAIIKKKAKANKIDLPDEVAHYIGANIDTNIRELEGALSSVKMHSQVDEKRIDLDLCREALKDSFPGAARKMSLGDILNSISTFFSVKVSDLQSKKRSKSIVFPRQLCMFLAREMTDFSLEEIGSFLGGRDHTTVIYAIEKIKKTMTVDPHLIGTIEEIKKVLKHQKYNGL